jgi:hypothetical protein
MKTQQLQLQAQVRPQRVDTVPAKADTQPKESIFENQNFLDQLEKGPKEAFMALRKLNPEQLAEFLQSENKNSGIKYEVMNDLARRLQRDLASPSSQKVFTRQLAEYQNNPGAARAKIEQVFAKLSTTQAPKAVVENAPVIGKVTLAPKIESGNKRVLAEVLAANAA